MISVEEALEQACDESGLPSYYRSCVMPVLHAPRSRWPRCCGGGCEPCAETLKRVAERVLELTGAEPPEE